jgi:hypothetical protein
MSQEAWRDSIRKSSEAYEALQNSWETHDTSKILLAVNNYKQAEIEREIATVEAGYLPAFPPKTEQGREKYGLTEAQVQDLITKMNC